MAAGDQDYRVGGQAFPGYEHFIYESPHTGERKVITGQPHGGMTLRDYFAAQVLNGLVDGTKGCERYIPSDTIAGYAYELADAMLKERAK